MDYDRLNGKMKGGTPMAELPQISSPNLTPVSENPQEEGQKASALQRIVADIIDRILPFPLLTYFFPPWILVVIGYGLLSDGLLEGCSVGKRLMGLRTVIVANDNPCNFARSFLRNVGWTVGQLCYLSLWLIPFAFTYDLVELMLVLFSPTGQRLGDRLAGTQVRGTCGHI